MKKLPVLGVFTLLAAGWMAPTARADFVFQTSPGGKASNGEVVNAKATFTLNANAIAVKLENLIVDQKDVGQSITGVTFTLNKSTTGASLTSSTGIQRDLTASSGGGFTYKDTILNTPNKNNTGWGFPVSNGTQLSLDWFSRNKTITGGQTQYTLLGQPGSNNKYNNIDSSLTNGAHNPPLAGPLFFFLNVPGVTSTTLVTDVTFFFGTSAGVSAKGHSHATPAPAAIALAATGMGGLGLFRLFRRRRSV